MINSGSINIGGCTTATARENASEKLLVMAAGLAEQMKVLCDRVNNRLEPILISKAGDEGKQGEQPMEAWPPYFSKVRQSLNIIQANIYGISDAIDRLEI